MPVAFEIPETCLPSDDQEEGPFEWRVFAKGQAGGVVMDLEFGVVVVVAEGIEMGGEDGSE